MIPIPLDVQALVELSAMKTMIVPGSWLVKTKFVSTHAAHCHVEQTLYAYLNVMPPGAVVKVASKRTRKLENASASARE